MTSGTGSITLTGLLGGTAGQIDTTSLISQLMTAAAVPQGQLYDQLNTQQSLYAVYQTINTKLTSLQTAAQAITDPTLWTQTAAVSSDPSVVATSTGSAVAGTTNFTVMQTATSQVTTIQADASGNVIAGTNVGVSVNGKNVVPPPLSGGAADVAAAINASGQGVRASVIHTSQGLVVQVVATATGAADSTGPNGSFTLTATSSTATDFVNGQNDVQTAQDAQIGVGVTPDGSGGYTIGAGGYTIASHTNTFTDAIPGTTLTVSAPGKNVSVTVSQDQQNLTNKVQALVTAANTVTSELQNDTQQGSPLQGTSALNQMINSVLSSVSMGTATGGSLSTYGIDIDKNGVMSFDAGTFAAAYAADPTGTQAAITGFGQSLATTTNNALDPTHGTVTLAMSGIQTTEASLNTSISSWTNRLNDMKTSLTAKFTAMETALATLQSKQTYLTSMFNSINGTSSTSKSS